MSSIRTLDQQRAAHAWDRVQRLARSEDKTWDRFYGQLKKLPVRILSAGLGQALAFLHARGECPDLITALDDWIARQRAPEDTERLIERLIRGNVEFQRFATAEVQSYLAWMVRFGDQVQTQREAERKKPGKPERAEV